MRDRSIVLVLPGQGLIQMDLNPSMLLVCLCRRGGDVIVIEMQSCSNQLRGRVIAVLSPPSYSPLG